MAEEREFHKFIVNGEEFRFRYDTHSREWIVFRQQSTQMSEFKIYTRAIGDGIIRFLQEIGCEIA